MINTLLTMSLTGSAVVLAWLVADRVTGKRLSAVWHDRILRLALFFMLVPIGTIWEAASKAALAAFFTGHTVQVPNVMQIAPVVTPDNALAVVSPAVPELPPVVQTAPVTVSADVFRLLALVWAVGAIAALCWKAWSYVRFRKLMGGDRCPLREEEMRAFAACKRELGVNRRIEAAVIPGLPTPVVTGLLQPVILLPDVTLSGEELRYLFLHEITHIKRRDLWVRFFALWGVVLHWYNPFMNLLDRKLKQSSEQSCDEWVARSMSGRERLAYGGMLLKLACGPEFRNGSWAVTLSTREAIQKRLGSIVKAGHWTRADKIVAFVTAVGLLCCGAVVACSMQEPLAVEREPQQIQREEPDISDSMPVQKEEPNVQNLPQEEPDVPEVQVQPPMEHEDIVTAPAEEPQVEEAQPPETAEISATVTIGGVNHEVYVDNLGITRLKSSVGNPEGLYITNLLALDTLVGGKYPINNRGETYGLEELADYVGETPLLIAVSSRGSDWEVQDGYLWWEDYYADFSDPAVASKYEAYSSDANWLNVPYEEPVSGWFVPLYDAEHEQIGVCSMEHSVPRWESGEIRSLEDSAKRTEGAPESTTIQTDEMEGPIAMPEGAIIIDGVAYPRPANNHGIAVIYDAGGGLAPHQQAILDALPNGTYPQNSRGEYYGSDEVAAWLNIEPDLILATGAEGQEGYVWWEDAKIRFECLEDIEKVVWNEHGYLIPLYDSEHNQIGWKQEKTPLYNVQGDHVQITKETVDVLRSLLS